MDCFLVSVVVLFGAGVSAAAFRKMEHGFGPYNLRAAMLPPRSLRRRKNNELKTPPNGPERCRIRRPFPPRSLLVAPV